MVKAKIKFSSLSALTKNLIRDDLDRSDFTRAMMFNRGVLFCSKRPLICARPTHFVAISGLSDGEARKLSGACQRREARMPG